MSGYYMSGYSILQWYHEFWYPDLSLSLSIYILYQICLASPSFNDIMSSGILVHLYIYPIPDMSGYLFLQWYHKFLYPGSSLYISYTRYVLHQSINQSILSRVPVSWYISVYILYQICLATSSFNDISSSGILVHLYVYTSSTRYVWLVHPSMISRVLVSWYISIYMFYQICLASPSFNNIMSFCILVLLIYASYITRYVWLVHTLIISGVLVSWFFPYMHPLLPAMSG